MNKLKIVKHEEIIPYATRASRDGISMRDAKDCIWFHYVDGDDNVIGACALLPLKNSKARLKAVWIKPEHRNAGNGSDMAQKLIEFARAAGADSLEVIAYNPKFYEARGFKKIGNPRPNGAQRLIKEPV